MGLSMLSSWYDYFSSIIYSTKEYRLLMLGLDGAGKTTILCKLKGIEVISLSTLGFNVDTVEYRNVSFTVCDVGGPRPIWRQFYRGTSGLIFVVDSNDFARLDEARSVLHSVLQDNEMQDVVVLILANKQDLPDAVSAAAMCDKLQLRTLKNECYIQSCTAMTSAGLFDGMDWLSKVLSCRKP